MIVDNKHTNFHYLQCQLAFPFNVAHLMRYFMLMTFEQLHFIECLSFWLKPYKTHYYLFSCLKIHEEKKRNNTAHSLTSISTKEKKWNKTKSMHSLCTVYTHNSKPLWNPSTSKFHYENVIVFASFFHLHFSLNLFLSRHHFISFCFHKRLYNFFIFDTNFYVFRRKQT